MCYSNAMEERVLVRLLSGVKRVSIIKCVLKSPNGVLPLHMFHLEFSIPSKNAVLSFMNNRNFYVKLLSSLKLKGGRN